MLIPARPKGVSDQCSPAAWCSFEPAALQLGRGAVAQGCGAHPTPTECQQSKFWAVCTHLDLFSIAQELRIGSISRVNTVYFGAGSVWKNTFPISREEFSQFTNFSMFAEF